jgi:hypothetical protein
MVKVLDRESINRMTRNSGRGGSTYVGGGGGGGYTLPLAADGTRGGVQIGFTTDATDRKYAVQLDNEKAYVNVPWTDHYSWSDITNKPSAAGGSTTPVYWNGSGFSQCTSYANASVNYANSAGSAGTAGKADYAYKVYCTSHPDTWYLSEDWDNTYFWLTAKYENSQLPCAVSYASNSNWANGAGYISDGTMDLVAQYNNEVNFGGSDGSSIIYFGYRARGSKGIPTSFIFGGGSGSASITCNGLYSNSYVTALSDARKKNVLSDVILSAEQLAQMPAVRFEWKDPEKPGTFIGTLAQSWREILPEAIHTISPDDDTLTFDYQSAALVAVVNLAREIQDIKMKLKRYGFK